MEKENAKIIEEKISLVLNLLAGLSYDTVSEILREASHKARKKSILIKESPNH